MKGTFCGCMTLGQIKLGQANTSVPSCTGACPFKRCAHSGEAVGLLQSPPRSSALQYPGDTFSSG